MQNVTLKFERDGDYRMNEAFKTLRTNIKFCGNDIKVIAITSCIPNEGKTSIAMEMARSFAEEGIKTMLIDADMRKSVLVGRYKTGAVKMGLTHSLIGQENFLDVICRSNIPNLYITFAGPVPPNPSELLGSEKFSAILKALKATFDYVIVDTPPLGSVIDAAVVAGKCDGTVLVVESNTVSYRFARSVKKQLDKAGSKILGVVLNKVDMNSKGYYGQKYYGKYYGRYGEEEISDHS